MPVTLPNYFKYFLDLGIDLRNMSSHLLKNETIKIGKTKMYQYNLANLFWRRTAVSQEWLAEKLSMKSAVKLSPQMTWLATQESAGSGA